MSTLTARMMTAVPHTPLQAPASMTGSIISGFELDEKSYTSTPGSDQNTPGAASVICAATETRIDQLLEENDLLAQELRNLHRKIAEDKDRNKQKKERKSREKKAKLKTDIWRKVLRFVTAVLTPLPEGSLGRFVVMVVEALWLRQNISALV